MQRFIHKFKVHWQGRGNNIFASQMFTHWRFAILDVCTFDICTSGRSHIWPFAHLAVCAFNICTCGCLHLWIFAHLDSGHLHIWMFLLLDICTSGHLHFWKFAHLDLSFSGCLLANCSLCWWQESHSHTPLLIIFDYFSLICFSLILRYLQIYEGLIFETL